MIRLLFVGSGSKGNATLLFSGTTLIQIDMGLPLKRMKEGVREFGLELKDIQALFLTHNHSDHIKGIPLYHDRIPIYTGEGTYEGKIGQVLVPGVETEVGDIRVMPFSSSHDAPNPLNFLFEVKGERLAYITDTGVILEENLPLLENCDYYLFESNHDLKMLRLSSRPASLKARIRGKEGHLSNMQASEYLSDLLGPKTKEIYLAHLSEECNDPEVALNTFSETFKRNHVSFPLEKIIPTKQRESVKGGDWE